MIKKQASRKRTMRADRLRDMRELRRLTQEDIAERTGISLRQILRYESGSSDPTAENITRMAKVLECSVDYLVGLSDDPAGRLNEDQLSPDERNILRAYRRGDLKHILYLLATDEKLVPEPNK